MPNPPSKPYPISVLFQRSTNNGSTYTNTAGARIWMKNITSGGNTPDQVKDKFTVSITDAKGQVTLGLESINSTYANNDTVRIFYQYGDVSGYTDHTVSMKKGFGSVTIQVIDRSGLTDGLWTTKSLAIDGAYRPERGCQKGTKDGLS